MKKKKKKKKKAPECSFEYVIVRSRILKRNARTDETVPEGSAVPSKSAKVREVRGHGGSDISERSVCVAQLETALLQQADLRKFDFH